MKFQTQTVLVLLGALSGLVSAAPAAENSARDCKCSTSTVNKLMFDTSMKSFQDKRGDKDPSCCDWSADGCSSAFDNPAGFKFIDSCERHDFGYRNFKDLKKLSEDMRKKVDDNFKKDLYNECEEHSAPREAECKVYADIYYEAVRSCGDDDCLALDVADAVSDAWESVEDTASDAWDAAKDAGGDIVDGIKDGFSDLFG